MYNISIVLKYWQLQFIVCHIQTAFGLVEEQLCQTGAFLLCAIE